MIHRLLSSVICLVTAVDIAAFSTLHIHHSATQHRMITSQVVVVHSSPESVTDTIIEDTDDDDVTCYVVNDEEIITEGEKPHVVCTSEPDDYAWFNGIDPQNMRETDGTEEGAENCVEGESYKGNPEWECE